MSDESLKNITVQIDADLLAKLDDRADAMDLNRSQYVRRLLRKDFGVTLALLPDSPLPSTLAPYQFVNKERELKVCGLCAREQNVALSDQDREAVSVCPKHVKIELRKVA